VTAAKTKAPIKELFVFDEVYRVALNVVICSDTTEWDRWLDDIKFDKSERLDHTKVDGIYYRLLPEHCNGSNGNLIMIKTKNFPVLIHEISHLIFQVFDEKGVPLRLENDEAFAYYLEFWFNKIRKAW